MGVCVTEVQNKLPLSKKKSKFSWYCFTETLLNGRSKILKVYKCFLGVMFYPLTFDSDGDRVRLSLPFHISFLQVNTLVQVA